jgi:hypothetical protein
MHEAIRNPVITYRHDGTAGAPELPGEAFTRQALPAWGNLTSSGVRGAIAPKFLCVFSAEFAIGGLVTGRADQDVGVAVACTGNGSSGRWDAFTLVLYPQLVEQDTKRRGSLIVADPRGHQVDAERVDQWDPWHVLHDLPVDVLPGVVSRGSVGGL